LKENKKSNTYKLLESVEMINYLLYNGIASNINSLV